MIATRAPRNGRTKRLQAIMASDAANVTAPTAANTRPLASALATAGLFVAKSSAILIVPIALVLALARLIEVRNRDYAISLWKKLESLRLGDPVPFCEQARLHLPDRLTEALKAYESCLRLLQGAEPEDALVIGLADAISADADELHRGLMARAGGEVRRRPAEDLAHLPEGRLDAVERDGTGDEHSHAGTLPTRRCRSVRPCVRAGPPAG